MTLGTVTADVRGVTYWITDADGVTDIRVPKGLDGVYVERWKHKDHAQAYTVTVPAALCEPRPQVGLRPAKEIKVTPVGRGGKALTPLVLA